MVQFNSRLPVNGPQHNDRYDYRSGRSAAPEQRFEQRNVVPLSEDVYKIGYSAYATIDSMEKRCDRRHHANPGDTELRVDYTIHFSDGLRYKTDCVLARAEHASLRKFDVEPNQFRKEIEKIIGLDVQIYELGRRYLGEVPSSFSFSRYTKREYYIHFDSRSIGGPVLKGGWDKGWDRVSHWLKGQPMSCIPGTKVPEINEVTRLHTWRDYALRDLMKSYEKASGQ